MASQMIEARISLRTHSSVGRPHHARTGTRRPIGAPVPRQDRGTFNYLPGVRAVLALNRAQPQHALELLQTAAPHEFGIAPSAVSGLFGALYPIYVRGQAYLALKKPSQPAAEFQKILDHRGIVTDDPIGAVAHYQIARAYTQSGDKVKRTLLMKRFSLSGRMPTPTLLSFSKPTPTTRSYRVS